MNKLLIVLLLVLFSSSISKDDGKECSEFKYSIDLNFTIPEIRTLEKGLNSIEKYSSINYSFGYRKTPLKNNEKNQPKFFLQKLDDHLVERTYYYDLPDSNIYAVMYEWKDAFRPMENSKSPNYFKNIKPLTEEYLKCQFQKLTGQIKNKIGTYKEYENYGSIREWEYNDTTIHLNLTLENGERRLRFVIYKR